MLDFENFQKIIRNFSKFNEPFKLFLIPNRTKHLNLHYLFDFHEMAHIMHNQEHKRKVYLEGAR